MPMSTPVGNADRYINATLAALTSTFLVAALVFDVVAFIKGPETILPLEGRTVTILGFAAPILVLSVFWLWGRMLHDYFKNRPHRNAVGWGWSLFLLNVGAAVAYYWFVWRPRNGERSSPV